MSIYWLDELHIFVESYNTKYNNKKVMKRRDDIPAFFPIVKNTFFTYSLIRHHNLEE